MVDLGRVLLLIFIVTLVPITGFADNFILRGLYNGSTELPLKYSGTLGGYSISETDTYSINSGLGIGFDYEVQKAKKGLAFSGGLDYFLKSEVPSVKYSVKSAYWGNASGSVDLDTSVGHEFQINYLFGRIKYYYDSEFFVGGEASLPYITLIGDYWGDLKITGELGFGWFFGYKSEDFNIELVFRSNPLSMTGLDSLEKKSTYTMTAFSIGYYIPIEKEPVQESRPVKVEPVEKITMPETEAVTGDLDELEKLHKLKEKGVITEDEYNAKKKQILGL